MDYIEAHVQLPEDAGPLRGYDRYYSHDASGRVTALYVHGVVGKGNEPAGERRWVTDERQFPPPILDGGCSVVHVDFDPSTGKLAAQCNGVA